MINKRLSLNFAAATAIICALLSAWMQLHWPGDSTNTAPASPEWGQVKLSLPPLELASKTPVAPAIKADNSPFVSYQSNGRLRAGPMAEAIEIRMEPSPQERSIPQLESKVISTPSVPTTLIPHNLPPTTHGDLTPRVELAKGVQEPAALLSDGSPLTPTQEKARHTIAEDFSTEVSKALKNPSSADHNLDHWLDAKANADENYRALFGDEAYNRKSIQAGQEAVAAE